MERGSNSRHVGAGTAVGGVRGAAAHTWLLSQTHHMLRSSFHTSAGFSRNTWSLVINQTGLNHLALLPPPTNAAFNAQTCTHVHGGTCAKHPFVCPLHSNGHTAGLLQLKESGKQNRVSLCLLTSAVWFHLESTVGQHTHRRCVSAVKHDHCKVHRGTLSLERGFISSTITDIVLNSS